MSKQSAAVKKFNANAEVSLPSTSSGSMTGSFTNDQMMKLLSLINEKPSANVSASMAGMKTTFVNNNVLFNLNIDRFFCAKTGSVSYNVTLGWVIDSGVISI